MLGIIVLIVLLALVVGALPIYPYSRKWGYYPGAFLTLVLIVVIVMVLTGRL